MHILSILCASLALIPSQDDFREKYAELDTLPKINNLVYDGAVVPMWTDTTGFVYVTREADGLKYFHVEPHQVQNGDNFCRVR